VISIAVTAKNQSRKALATWGMEFDDFVMLEITLLTAELNHSENCRSERRQAHAVSS